MSRYQDEEEIVYASVLERKDEDAHYLEFRFPENTVFKNAVELFQALRDLVMSHHKGAFWMVKTSARVTCSNMPILHDPVNLRVLVDILQPIRDPAREVSLASVIRLYYIPSKAHFFRKKIHAKPVRLGSVSEPGSPASDSETG